MFSMYLHNYYSFQIENMHVKNYVVKSIIRLELSFKKSILKFEFWFSITKFWKLNWYNKNISNNTKRIVAAARDTWKMKIFSHLRIILRFTYCKKY